MSIFKNLVEGPRPYTRLERKEKWIFKEGVDRTHFLKYVF